MCLVPAAYRASCSTKRTRSIRRRERARQAATCGLVQYIEEAWLVGVRVHVDAPIISDALVRHAEIQPKNYLGNQSKVRLETTCVHRTRASVELKKR